MAARLNPHRAAILRQIGQWKTHVFRDPGYPNRPGGGITRQTLDRLSKDGHITLGDYEPLHGRLLTLTEAGRQALADYDEAAAR